MAAGYDGGAASERVAGPPYVELYGRAVWAKVVEVSAGLGVKRVVARGGPGFNDEDLQRRIGIGEAAGDDTPAGAT